MSLSGILGSIFTVGSQIFSGDDGISTPTLAKPVGSAAATVMAARGAAPPVSPGAPGVIALILGGSGDAAVRAAARSARVGKKQLLETLVAMDMSTRGGAFAPNERMFISNEIEKIFKQRPRRTIPKSLSRTVKQINWIKKNLRGLFK